MTQSIYEVVFVKNGNNLSPVYMNKNILELKNEEGVIYAFNDLDEGFIFYENMVHQLSLTVKP